MSSRRDGPVTDRGETNDNGDVLVSPAGCRHTCSSIPITLTNLDPVEAVWGINEHVSALGQDGFVRGQRIEPWMTTIVDLDTGQILGVVDGRDHTGAGDWLLQRPLPWRLGVQVVAVDPSAAFLESVADVVAPHGCVG